LIHFYKRIMMPSIFLYVFGGLVVLASCQQRSTWPPDISPGEECLPYDGSKVPDCREFVNPITKEPYYHPHSWNCSRFWECGPTYETCLFECAHCNNEAMDNPLCKGQQALTFDPAIQWPIGPVCNWPTTIDCDNGNVPCDCLPWQSCINGLCSPQCIQDSDCPAGYICDDCNWCVEGGNGCDGDDSLCLQGVCDVPFPYTTCEYCGDGNACLPGCSTDSNCPEMYPVCGGGGGDHLCGCTQDADCPSGYICDSGSHVCTEDLGCNNNNANCNNVMCDVIVPPSPCEYCGGKDCLPGCGDNSQCPADYPICGHGINDHTCGCNADADCAGLGPDYTCDVNNHQCVEPAPCTSDAECDSQICDIVNTPDYTTCFYCDNGVCTPGCSSNQFCPTGFICSVNHLCEEPASGITKLTKIKISGAGGGMYTLIVEGTTDFVGQEPPECTTPQLSGDGLFTGDAQLGEALRGGCFEAPLDGEVSSGEAQGAANWSGTATACFEWDSNKSVVNCNIIGGSFQGCSYVGVGEC